MRARGVTTPLLIATASSSIDLNTVSSPGESSIRYMPDLMGAGFRAKGGAEEPDFTQLSRSGSMHFRSCRADRSCSLQPLCLRVESYRTINYLAHDRSATLVLLSAACLGGRKFGGMSHQK